TRFSRDWSSDVCSSDLKTDPDWIAMDLFSQAEHDEQAQSILISTDAAFLDAVNDSINKLLPQMSRQAIIRTSMSGRGALIHARKIGRASCRERGEVAGA